MGNKVAVRHYKYKNIAAAMAIALLTILAISTSCNTEKAEKNSKPSVQVSTESKTDKNEDNSSSAPFKAEKLTKNYKYVNVKNDESLGWGSLILLNSTYEYSGGEPNDLDGVYGYLFDKNQQQIGSTSSTEVMGRKEMLEAFREMLCAFYDETGLKTIMVSDMYIGTLSDESVNDSENSESSEAEQSVPEKPCFEHDSGLAVDLQLYFAQEGTYPEFDGKGKYVWFAENCWKYGFVQRYTEDKASATGVDAIANHFRYVGRPHAQIMRENSLSLEEYIEFLKHYTFDNPLSFEDIDGNCYALYYTVMSSDKATNCPIPLAEDDSEYDYEISGDNSGGYILCVNLVPAQDNEDKNSDDSQASVDESSSLADVKE